MVVRNQKGSRNPKWGQNKYGITKFTLHELYNVQSKSTIFIAQKFGCSLGQVQYYMKKFGIKTRSLSKAQKIRHSNPETRLIGLRGKCNPNYKHGKYTSESIYRKLVDNSECSICGKKDGQIDRHHKNNDHFDNRKCNILVLCAECHSRLHKLLYWRKQKN